MRVQNQIILNNGLPFDVKIPSNKILNEETLHLSLFEQKIYELKFIKKETPREIAKELDCEVKKIYDAIDRIRKKARKK